jgi:hypothetical protein
MFTSFIVKDGEPVGGIEGETKHGVLTGMSDFVNFCIDNGAVVIGDHDLGFIVHDEEGDTVVTPVHRIDVRDFEQ